MEEKQEFQLGDTFFYIGKQNNKDIFYCISGIVNEIKTSDKGILIAGHSTGERLQKDCGHTFEETKQKIIDKYESLVEELKNYRL